MSQVLKHDYGKGTISLSRIRKAVLAAKANSSPSAKKSGEKRRTAAAAGNSRSGS
jgi:hypothetical protein